MSNRSYQPTLWRTCRVLANPDRLRLFSALTRKQPQTVSSLAEQVGISLPKASMYLRAMESRGLLSARRVGRKVEYQIPSGSADLEMSELLKSLRELAKGDERPLSKIFSLATGFTHPARIETYRKIAAGLGKLDQLAKELKLSPRIVARQLKKLTSRGYIATNDHRYEVAKHPEAVGRALADLALR